jgi:transposase
MSTIRPTAPDSEAPIPQYVVGIDIGSATCSLCALHLDKTVAGKPFEFSNTGAGFVVLAERLTRLAPTPAGIVVGMEATARYWENLYTFLVGQGYRVVLLHPGQTHQFAQQRGLRAKTDRLDATTIARLLLSDEVRPAYVPSEEIATYRELVRMHSNLAEEGARYQLEIQSLVGVLFPELTQVFADPCRPTALAVLQAYPSAAALAGASVEAVLAVLHQAAPRRYGRQHAQRLITLAQNSVASGVARAARALSLGILCEQLERTHAHLAQLEAELQRLLATDAGAASLSSVEGFGLKTVALLRAELGEVARFTHGDQVVAYVGLDITVKQSGKWRGQRKLSKRGSGEVRRVLYMAALRSIALEGSAFREYYQHLVEHGRAKKSALMAVMRKMLLIAYRLLKSGGHYDASKVWAAPKRQPAPPGEAALAAA